MKDKLRYLFSVLIIVAGVVGLLYPTVSNYLNERNNSRVVQSYDTTVAKLSEEKRSQIFEAAVQYNSDLLKRNGYDTPMKDEDGNAVSGENYSEMLNMSGNGVMGYLNIPKLNETIPIFHGTSESVLQSGVGHIENTSLPVGGENTHAALSGHRGLPSKRLFTDLDQMNIGDVFYIKVINETLAYQVDKILVVTPNDMSSLAVEEGGDFVTLVTCTPYSINTHRLLVRGMRIPYEEAKKIQKEIGEAKSLSQSNKELFIAAVVIVVYFLIRFLIGIIKKRKHKKGSKN